MEFGRYFSAKEFECKCGCGASHISQDLVDRLRCAREAVGFALAVTSGVRCEEHNAKCGGSEDSAHLRGLAADILCPSSVMRFRMLQDFMRRFERIGIGPDFIHVDIDREKVGGVVWVY